MPRPFPHWFSSDAVARACYQAAQGKGSSRVAEAVAAEEDGEAEAATTGGTGQRRLLCSIPFAPRPQHPRTLLLLVCPVWSCAVATGLMLGPISSTYSPRLQISPRFPLCIRSSPLYTVDVADQHALRGDPVSAFCLFLRTAFFPAFFSLSLLYVDLFVVLSSRQRMGSTLDAID